MRARIGNIVQSIPRHESYDGKAKPRIGRELPSEAHASSRSSPERKKKRGGGWLSYSTSRFYCTLLQCSKVSRSSGFSPSSSPSTSHFLILEIKSERCMEKYRCTSHLAFLKRSLQIDATDFLTRKPESRLISLHTAFFITSSWPQLKLMDSSILVVGLEVSFLDLYSWGYEFRVVCCSTPMFQSRLCGRWEYH
jgi:hypothetical protein